MKCLGEKNMLIYSQMLVGKFVLIYSFKLVLV